MLEIVYTLILSGLFFLMSRRERKFQRNRGKYIDDARVFLSEEKNFEAEE